MYRLLWYQSDFSRFVDIFGFSGGARPYWLVFTRINFEAVVIGECWVKKTREWGKLISHRGLMSLPLPIWQRWLPTHRLRPYKGIDSSNGLDKRQQQRARDGARKRRLGICVELVPNGSWTSLRFFLSSVFKEFFFNQTCIAAMNDLPPRRCPQISLRRRSKWVEVSRNK